MDTKGLPEEVMAVGEALRRFLAAEVVPLERANADLLSSPRRIYDETGRYTPEILALRAEVRRKSAEAGFYTMFGPAPLGGGGFGPVAAVYLNALVSEEAGPGRVLVHPVVIPSPFTNGLSPVLTHLDPALHDRYLPGVASGERTSCFALSEPDAGSDVFAMTTRATRDGDDWVLTGTKQWITNGPYADHIMVFAVTDPDMAAARKGGITGFLVNADQPGFGVVSPIPTMGELGAEIGILSFDQVRVSDSHRLGPVDEGLKVAMTGVNIGRLGLSATCVGLARWALAQSLDYARERRTFGQAIGRHGAVESLLAECALDIYAAETMLLDAARRLERGERALAELSMVKWHCTEAAHRVFDRAIQVHGGMGLTNELRLEAGFRFTRTMRIPDGTTEIQRRTVARDLLKNGLGF